MKKNLLLMVSIFFIGLNCVYAKEKVTFSKCVDGDTIKVILDDEEHTVRMLAIDTPESVHPTKGIEYYGKEASDYTCDKVSNAKKLELEYDDNSDKFDKYDRLLAWVFVDGTLLQEELIANGYAKIAYLYNDYKYTSILQEKQELASAKELGIWNETAKKEYESKLTTDTYNSDDYSIKEIIIIVILLLIIAFVSDKTIKSRAKKKLKTYLK